MYCFVFSDINTYLDDVLFLFKVIVWDKLSKPSIVSVSDAESPEVDRFTVQLKKDENGLGITIAGITTPSSINLFTVGHTIAGI